MLTIEQFIQVFLGLAFTSLVMLVFLVLARHSVVSESELEDVIKKHPELTDRLKAELLHGPIRRGRLEAIVDFHKKDAKRKKQMACFGSKSHKE